VQLEIDGEEVANCLYAQRGREALKSFDAEIDGQGVRGDLFPTITVGDAPIGGTGRGGGPVPILAQSLEPTQMSSVPIYSLYGRALREQPQRGPPPSRSHTSPPDSTRLPVASCQPQGHNAVHIEKNRVVTFNYTLRDDQGTVIDSSGGRGPLSYLHGKGNIIPGLEQALAGKAAGDKLDVTVAPEKGYGARDERLVQIVAKAKFGEVAGLAPGMQVRATGPQGPRIVTVVSVDRDFVTVDGNHPLAGRTLHFSLEVAEVRKATHEEISHGHVHGPGGHHH
jgi:FKBP-type peptidyl-prolyl cis-trans isomerase SlyD